MSTERAPFTRRNLVQGARILVLAGLYAVTARLGLSLDPVGRFATLVWAPSGIALAALVVFGYGIAPGVLLGALAANVLTGAPLLVALGIATGNTLEALAGAFAMRRVSGAGKPLAGLRQVFALILLAALASTLVSATIGLVSLSLGGLVAPGLHFQVFRTWWVGDVLGNMIVAPLLLAGTQIRGGARRTSVVVEGIFLAISMVAFSTAVFFRPQVSVVYPFESPYLLFPFLIWAAVRFQLLGATVSTAIASALAIWGTVRGSGPFVRETLSQGLLALQTFMGCAALTPLVVAGAISDRARLEEDLRAAVRARDDFLAVAGHELKTPLAAMLMQLQGLQRAARGESTRLRDRLSRAERNGARLGRLIDQLLDVSRVTAGRLRLEPEHLDLSEIVREVVQRFSEGGLSGVPISFESDAGVYGRWDRLRLEQVVDNLVGNAVKYGGGKPVEVELRAAGGETVLTVTDHGIGVSPEHQRKIFQRFERAVAARDFGGLGLGLWISRQIVEASGGTIAVFSRAGEGATFSVRLPREESGSPGNPGDNRGNDGHRYE